MRTKLLFPLIAAVSITTGTYAGSDGYVTTREREAQKMQQIKQLRAEMKRYVDAAKARYKTNEGVLTGIDRSGQAMEAYIKGVCGAVYSTYEGGSFAGIDYANCEAEILQKHTHIIWEKFLTSMDSTPPMLPEPKVKEE